MMTVNGARTAAANRPVEYQVAVEDGLVRVRAVASTRTAAGAWSVMSPRVADELAELIAKAAREARGVACAGLTARWCPVHGDCLCTPEREHPRCPLHSAESTHAEAS